MLNMRYFLVLCISTLTVLGPILFVSSGHK